MESSFKKRLKSFLRKENNLFELLSIEPQNLLNLVTHFLDLIPKLFQSPDHQILSTMTREAVAFLHGRTPTSLGSLLLEHSLNAIKMLALLEIKGYLGQIILWTSKG